MNTTLDMLITDAYVAIIHILLNGDLLSLSLSSKLLNQKTTLRKSSGIKTTNFYNYKNGDSAAYHGYLALMKEKLSILNYSYSPIDHAAAGGHLMVVIWLHENGKMCTINAMDWAAENGFLEIVKWLHENRREGCTTYAMDWASRNGHFEVVKWLHKHRKEGCTSFAMTWAIRNGQFEVVKWLYDHRKEYYINSYSMYLAIKNNHHELAQWLREHLL